MTPGIQAIEPMALKALLASSTPPHLLDVRQPEEHAFVALPNSKLIPVGELLERAQEIAHWRDQPVVVYCHHGVRSMQAARQLSKLGFSRVMNLAGGISEYSHQVDQSLPDY